MLIYGGEVIPLQCGEWIYLYRVHSDPPILSLHFNSNYPYNSCVSAAVVKFCDETVARELTPSFMIYLPFPLNAVFDRYYSLHN